jgi:indole-3-glycerol phosphate synthase
LQAGSDAISILTEPYFFQGDVHYLRDIRHEFTESNLLLKDFVLSKKQVRQAAYFGANAILLIKSILSESDLKDLYEYAVSLSLTPIVEVHDLSELRAVSKLSPKIIGINNRSLNTLNVDMNISRELIKHAPKSSYLVCESGVKSRCQIDEMHALGFDGFLVGSSLMKSDSPGRALTTLLEREMKTC